MGSGDDSKTPTTSSAEDSSSSGSSTETTDSTPHTPPSPKVELHDLEKAAIREKSQQNGRHSSYGFKRSPKTPPSKSRLGAIDEDSEDISPDVPVRNPFRSIGFPSLQFTLPSFPTLYAKRDPPKNIYDDIQGPRGEKFQDVRANKKVPLPSFWTWRKLVCLVLLAVMILAGVAIGLIVGLLRKKHVQNAGPPPLTGFPIGKYSITTYLTNTSTECTSVAETWRCYPFQTYAQAGVASNSTLNWIIAANGSSGYTISSADATFSFPFQNVPLVPTSNTTDAQAFEFTTYYDKVVVPTVALTDDGVAARCWFNNTKVYGTLYTAMNKTEALQNATPASTAGNDFQPWPYALTFAESVHSGASIPDCYKWVNGARGDPIAVNATAASDVEQICGCRYYNYFPSTWAPFQ